MYYHEALPQNHIKFGERKGGNTKKGLWNNFCVVWGESAFVHQTVEVNSFSNKSLSF